MLSVGWRMRASKKPAGGLAALRALRQQQKAGARAKAQEPAFTPDAAPGTFSALLNTAQSSDAGLTVADQALFKHETRHDIPLTVPERYHVAPLSTAIDKAQQQQRIQHATGPDLLPSLPLLTSDHYVPAWLESDPCEYSSPACGTDVLRYLKQGRWMIMANLDLHGARLDEARLLVNEFIQDCLDHHLKCIRIVHGVGYGSSNREGPILLPVVRRWLSQMHDVLAYVECSPREGGKGAVKVLLRTRRD